MKAEIKRLVEQGESETRELKGPQASTEILTRQICGMLNQQGGVVLWGVTDAKRIVGLENAKVRAKELIDYVARHIRPQPLLSITPETVDSRELVVIDVPAGADKPYSVDREIWIRIGTHTMHASPSKSAELVKRSAVQLERWEREVMPGFSLSACNPDEITQTRVDLTKNGRFGISVPDSDEDLLRNLNLMRGGQLTNGCVVLFAHQTRDWAPNLALRITSSSELRNRPMELDTILEGPAVQIVRNAIEIIQQRTGFSGAFQVGLQRTDRPAYAPFALREGLVNAVVHRNYAGLGDVRVQIYPDSLVIRNPGALPDGWTTQDLKKDHASKPINPDIARVFYLRGFMEQLGMGAQRLVAECKAMGAKAPIWSVEKGTVSLRVFRAPARMTLSPRQARFVEKRQTGSDFVLRDYARSTKVSERQARRDLQELEQLGLVERHGRGPATSYRLRLGSDDLDADRAQEVAIRSYRDNAPTNDRDAIKSVDAMVNWFFERYEDPANGVPYDGREGGYQYVAGGPYDAEEELRDALDDGSAKVNHMIKAAVRRIESRGTEWVKRGEY